MDAIECLKSKKPFLWANPMIEKSASVLPGIAFNMNDMRDAQARLYRFAPLVMELFSEETGRSGGLIESDLTLAPKLAEYLSQEKGLDKNKTGRVLIKQDHDLPVAGSVKARGGIYEVLHFAEKLAMKTGLLDYKDNYVKLLERDTKELFSKYTVSVGSTGNLGLSIGIMGSALGFKVDVHMSHEAKEWKKERLRKRGVNVVEHQTDYTAAVEAGRKETESNPFAFFVDDENSVELFLGYSVAAFRLKAQLEDLGIIVDSAHPLFVYLPCGIGGAPGGIAFGLKQMFGDAVHCFFAEPTEAPCMALGLISGKHADISVYDIGLENRTDADGLAVSRPSGFVGKLVAPLLSGAFTIDDDSMYRYVYAARKLADMKLEPSAAAGFSGPGLVMGSESGREYLEKHGLQGKEQNIAHILWTTGGRYVPDNEYEKFLKRGELFFSELKN